MIFTSPWRSTAQADKNLRYVALVGLVRLRTVLLLPTFIQFGFRIDRQLRRSLGLVGYRVASDPVNLRFFHLSAWHDAASIQSFVHTHSHLRAMQKLTGRLGATTFRYWEIDGSELPLQMEAEVQRLEFKQSCAPDVRS